MKKLLIVVTGTIFWALLLSLLVLGNAAPALTVSSCGGNVGDVLTLDVAMVNNPGFDVLQCEIDYDPLCLELLAVENCIDGEGKIYLPSGDSKVFIYFGLKYSDDNSILGKAPTVSASEVKIMRLTFEVLSLGETDVSVNVTEALKFDASYFPQLFAVSKGVGVIKASAAVAHTHSDVDSKWETDSLSHWHTCSCGEVFDKLYHSGGNATCTIKPKCEICAVEYGSVSPTAHTVSTKRIKRDDLLLVLGLGFDCLSYKQYYYECTVCHRPTSEKWTDTVTGEHKFSALIPAEREIHTENELKAGVAAYYRCTVCSSLFNDKKEPATMSSLVGEEPVHSFCDFIFDDIGHKQLCSCGKTNSFGVHTYDGDDDMVCDVCSYDRSCKHLRGLSYIPYNSASCTANGNIEYWYCKDCGKSFDGADPALASEIMYLILPALGHSFDKKLEDEAHIRHKAENCTERDSFWYSCSICEKISDKDFFENGNAGSHHTVTVMGYPKTCEGDGLSDSEFCTLCGIYVIDPIFIPSLGHAFGKWETVKAPALGEQGSKMRICENCDAQEFEVIPALSEETTEIPEVTTEAPEITTEAFGETTEYIAETSAQNDVTTEFFEEIGFVFDETTGVEQAEPTAGLLPWLAVIIALLVINLTVLIAVLIKKKY